MKKVFILVVLFTVVTGLFARAGRDSLFVQLNEAIKNKSYYDRQKEQQLAETKHLLKIQSILPIQAYDFHHKIAMQYDKYIIDSAIYYTQQSRDIAAAMRRSDLVTESDLHLSRLYTTAGMYIEAKNILLGIDRHRLPATLLPLYFETYSDFYGHYWQSNEQVVNTRLNVAYRDSLLAVLDTASLSYKIHHTVKMLHYGQLDAAEPYLLAMFRRAPKGTPDYAMVSYLLGLLYSRQGKTELQRQYLALAAITDIRNAIKDHAALHHLASSYYEAGEVDRAYTYIKSVLDDITFGQIRFRVVELTATYSTVNTAYLMKERQQKKELQRYFMLISVLFFFLIISVFYVYRQMRKVSKIKKELSETNGKLTELNQNISHANDKLHKMNARLSEANRIKEEYIAQFFDICSGYIDKLESYRKMLHKKAAGNQHEEVFKTLKSTTLVDEERKKLYETFDTVFLNLYPSFVEDFNSLLITEEKVTLKQGERLNTELRIFALIRLGITDSMKIAGFLRYSLSTIYNYRTRARNNTVVSRDEFEEMVMNIGNMQAKK